MYETILYLLTPFILSISLIVRPYFAHWNLFRVIGLYTIHTTIFNGTKEGDGSVDGCLVLYPVQVVSVFINITSCYWYISP